MNQPTMKLSIISNYQELEEMNYSSKMHNDMISDVASNYVERGEIESDLLDRIQERTDAHKIIIAHGPRGIGKTFFLDYLEYQLKEKATILRLNIDSFNIDSPSFLHDSIIFFLESIGIKNKPVSLSEDKKGARNTLRSLLKDSKIRIGKKRSIDLRIKDDLIQRVNCLRDTYLETVTNLSRNDAEYPNELAEVVLEAANSFDTFENDRLFVVLVDGLEFADRQVLIFLRRLIAKRPITFIGWTTNGLSSIESQEVRTFIEEALAPRTHHSLYSSSNIALTDLRPFRAFSIEEIESFLMKHGIESALSSERILEITKGIPRFVEIVVRNESEPRSFVYSDDSKWFEVFISEAIRGESKENEILRLIVANGGCISHGLLSSSDSDNSATLYAGAVDSLIQKSLLIKRDDCYHISVPIIQQYR